MAIDKSKVNFIIDALMFLCMTAIAGIGLLMRFVLLSGKDRWIVYGRNVELSLFGMDRHGWETIHLTIAFIFVGLLVIHIILHWHTILALYRRLIESKRIRISIATIFVAAALFFLAFPLFVKPQVEEGERGRRHVRESEGPFREMSTKTLGKVPDESRVPVNETPVACRGADCHPSHGDVRGIKKPPHPMK